MKIASFAHRGLKLFYEKGDSTRVPSQCVAKIRNMLAYVEAMEQPEELRKPILRWKAHKLTGDRAGTWALFLTANWRLTFTVNSEHCLCDLDLEDYH